MQWVSKRVSTLPSWFVGANFSNLFVVACGAIIARKFYDVMPSQGVRGKPWENPWTLPNLNRIQDISVEINTQQLISYR